MTAVEVVNALKDAQVPQLLILCGAFFVLLALVGKIGMIELRERHTWAAVFGGASLVTGVVLFVLQPSPVPIAPTTATAATPVAGTAGTPTMPSSAQPISPPSRDTTASHNNCRFDKHTCYW